MGRGWPPALLLAFALGAGNAEGSPPLLFQQPTLSASHVVFAFAGDFWIAPRDGGDASHLTTHPGIERDPAFSPDGSTVAFTGEYDGKTEVFAVPASGGVPRRVTYHPGPDSAVGWTPDGTRLLFRSSRDSLSHFTRLYTIAVDGAFSPGGKRLRREPAGTP